MTFVTGCLYLSTSSSKASRSPRFTRSIRPASGSGLAAMGAHVNKNRRRHKVVFLRALRRTYLDTATNVDTRGRSADLRPGGSGAGPGNAAGPEAGAPVVVVSRSRRARRIAEVPAVRPAPARKNSRPRAAFPNIVADMARVGPALT